MMMMSEGKGDVSRMIRQRLYERDEISNKVSVLHSDPCRLSLANS